MPGTKLKKSLNEAGWFRGSLFQTPKSMAGTPPFQQDKPVGGGREKRRGNVNVNVVWVLVRADEAKKIKYKNTTEKWWCCGCSTTHLLSFGRQANL